MQVDVMGECLSSIKHVVGEKISISGKDIARRSSEVKITPSCAAPSEKWRITNLLDDIWMLLPEVESLGSWSERPVQCDKLWLQSSNCSQHRFTTLRAISNLHEQPTGGSVLVVHTGTAPADEAVHCLTGQKKQAARQREKSLDTRHRRLDDRYPRFTVARRLHGGGLLARRPVRCVYL
ncbi:hypothetical protein TNCV_838931 [Trichonephila clavipes]|nr:hypothetical protein TNCV_838931 [Trichonephila clavipes]